MFKKFLAAIALMGVVATSTAFAQIGGYTVTPTTLNPFKVVNTTPAGAKVFESIKISLALTQAADIDAQVLDAAGLSVATLDPVNILAIQPSPIGTTFNYNWFGRAGNVPTAAVLADGNYTVRVLAYSALGAVIDSKFTAVTINTAAVPKIAGLKADPLSFIPEKNQLTDIGFTVGKDGYVKVVVKKLEKQTAAAAETSTVVKTFDKYDGNVFYKSTQSHSIAWDGKDDSKNPVTLSTSTAVFPSVAYAVEVTASNDDGSSSATTPVMVAGSGTVSKGVIKGMLLDPSQKWDPTEEELKIEFELVSEVKFLTIEAKQGNKVIEILDDEFSDDDDYEETWDGTDEDGDYIDQGVWEITVRADGDKVTQTIDVVYEQPNFVEAFVTKDSFDPSEDEFIYLVFKVNTTSEIDVDVFQGTKKIENLIDDESVKKNKWYAVKWDGMDEGEEVDFANNWRFRVSAENETDNDISANTSVEFDVEEDDVSDKKSNATNDYVDPVIFDDEEGSSVVFNYTLDEAADVFLAVYEGKSTGGNSEVELMDYVKQSADTHTIEWNGKDEKKKDLKDGIYTYKMITRTSGGQKDTEIGRFVVGNLGSYEAPEESEPKTEEEPKPDPKKPAPKPESTTCGMYSDTQFIEKNDYEMCLAIEWSSKQGIFDGYADGSFGPYNNISRAEVLKVAFEAFEDKVIILPNDGSSQGFSDTDTSAWYMPYVRTAKFYGMLHGYSDGTAKLGKNVSRSEFLKFILEASESFTGYVVPKYSFSYFADVNNADPIQSWYRDYAGVAYDLFLFNFYDQDTYTYGQPVWLKPAQAVTRGEVALALYRMYNGGLLGYYDEIMDMGSGVGSGDAY